jgi:hypothetical protein
MTEPNSPTLKEIGAAANQRTQHLLKIAKDAANEAEDALYEVTNAPYFTNGLAGAMKEAHMDIAKFCNDIERLAQQTHKHFHPDTEGDSKPIVTKGRE